MTFDGPTQRRVARKATPFYALLAASACADAPMRDATVPDDVTCQACTIAINTETRIGALEGPGALPGRPLDVAVDGRGRYWLVFPSGLPMVFDDARLFVAELGRRGEGPGEFASPFAVFPAPGDSMVVIDRRNLRATVVARDLEAGRTVALDAQYDAGAVIEWPDRVLLRARFNAQEPTPVQVFRVVSLAGAVAVVRGLLDNEPTDSSSSAIGSAGPMTLADWQPRRSTSPNGTGIWIADVRRYRLQYASFAGAATVTLERNPDWFASETPVNAIGSPEQAPSARIAAIERDESGRVWVFVHVPVENWRDVWTEFDGSDIQEDALFHTRVEVIDPSGARVLARTDIDGLVFDALAGPRVVLYSVDDNGFPSVSIVQLTLSAQ